MKENLVIIPTYNEKENIEQIILAIFSLSITFDILVVDDSSPDKTYEIVRKLQIDYPERLFLEIRAEKNGLGKAYIHGFQWALAHGYSYIYEMDADFSHSPADLERLYHHIANGPYDMVIGSRYSHGVNVINWDIRRVLLSYFASVYVRLITRLPIHDATAGFVVYKARVLESIVLDKINFSGYGFQIEMKFRAWSMGFALTEIPIIFTDRMRGSSKMNGNIISEAALGVIKLRLYQILGKL